MNSHIDDTDYINASWITGRREIATQGPLPNTVAYFLQMICEQNVEAIVMLTKTIEENRQSSFYFESFSVKGIVKCEQYWPELDQSLVFGHMVIKTLEETEVTGNEFYQRRLQVEGKFSLFFQLHVLHKQIGSILFLICPQFLFQTKLQK